MPLPKVINELPVIPKEDPRIVILPEAEKVQAMRAKGYSAMVRRILTARDAWLKPVDNIWQHIDEAESALEQISRAGLGIEGVIGKVAIPEHKWCLIELEPDSKEYDDQAHLFPPGFYLGAEIELVDGEAVCDHEADYTNLDALDASVPIAQKIVQSYLTSVTGTQLPTLRDVHPHQFMRSDKQDGGYSFSYVDIDPILSLPPQ